MQIGAKHVETPFIEFGQISTVLYFSHFLIIVPLVSLLENTLVDLNINKVTNTDNTTINKNIVIKSLNMKYGAKGNLS